MNVAHVIMMLVMTVYRIVIMYGVVLLQRMSVAHVIVMLAMIVYRIVLEHGVVQRVLRLTILMQMVMVLVLDLVYLYVMD